MILEYLYRALLITCFFYDKTIFCEKRISVIDKQKCLLKMYVGDEKAHDYQSIQWIQIFILVKKLTKSSPKRNCKRNARQLCWRSSVRNVFQFNLLLFWDWIVKGCVYNTIRFTYCKPMLFIFFHLQKFLLLKKMKHICTSTNQTNVRIVCLFL